MKFLLIVLAIHFVIEWFSYKGKEKEKEMDEVNDKIRHPAEFDLR